MDNLMLDQDGNQLAIAIRESGLEPAKGKVLFDQFQDYFAIADEWNAKAKAIVVTSPLQKSDMDLARKGRLILKEKRVTIEKTRKELKEQSLREGKAIDGIANILKALIVPIEEYLEKQEKFVELAKKAEDDMLLAKLRKQQEDERIAKAEADRVEADRLRTENERLRIEAAKKEAEVQAERDRVNRELQVAEAKAAAERAIEQKKLADAQAEIKKLEVEKENIKASQFPLTDVSIQYDINSRNMQAISNQISDQIINTGEWVKNNCEPNIVNDPIILIINRIDGLKIVVDYDDALIQFDENNTPYVHLNGKVYHLALVEDQNA